MDRPPAGIVALSCFFAFGAVAASLAGVALSLPGSHLDILWHVNTEAHAGLLKMGFWARPLMFVVAGGCGLSAIGLWIRARWGHRLALALLTTNLAGDVANAVIRDDLRTLVGIPIAGALAAYLLTTSVRAHFATEKASGSKWMNIEPSEQVTEKNRNRNRC
jgi:hypothetical protein